MASYHRDLAQSIDRVIERLLPGKRYDESADE
jgi:hypothetical protein